jgi:gas vesicle protein
MRTLLNFFAGLLVGSLIGASLALLFAPVSGEDLRLRIQDEVGRVRSEVSKAATEKRTEMEQQLAALRSPRKPGPANPEG